MFVQFNLFTVRVVYMDTTSNDCYIDVPQFKPEERPQVSIETNPFETNLTTDPSQQCQFVLHQRPYETRVAMPKCARCIRRRARSEAKFLSMWQAITDREASPPPLSSSQLTHVTDLE